MGWLANSQVTRLMLPTLFTYRTNQASKVAQEGGLADQGSESVHNRLESTGSGPIHRNNPFAPG